MQLYMYFNYPYACTVIHTILRVCVCVCVCVDEAHGDRSKDSIRVKCSQYLERAEQLRKHISKKVHPSGGGTAHKETKK